jgi:hypothetical protein
MQTGRAAPSGFLGDYSLLSKGGADEPSLIYVDDDADFSAYEKITINPVTIWRAAGSSLTGVPEEEFQQLADYLHASLRTALGEHFEVVEQSGPDVLRLRVAITEVRRAQIVPNIVSTVLPPARLLSNVQSMATGTHAFVGKAAIEGEVLDSQTNQRLAAMVDERAGGKTLSGSTNSWRDVYAAYDYWAQGLVKRLEAYRAADRGF